MQRLFVASLLDIPDGSETDRRCSRGGEDNGIGRGGVELVGGWTRGMDAKERRTHVEAPGRIGRVTRE